MAGQSAFIESLVRSQGKSSLKLKSFWALKKNVNENNQKGFIKSKLNLTNLRAYDEKEAWSAHGGT